MINITVCYATPQSQVEIPLTVAENCTIALAIQRSGIQRQFPSLSLATLQVGIYGRLKALDSPVSAGDRIEIYRPLVIDPKDRRRKMAKKIS